MRPFAFAFPFALPWASLALLCACGGAPAPAAPSGASGEIDLTRPEPAATRPAEPSPLAGLKPCGKDDEGCAVGAKKDTRPAPQAALPETTVWKVPVGPDDPVKGAADPLVTVVVFSDFQCPFCRLATSLFERVLLDFPDDVRVVWKDLPLPNHEHAEAAAELARAARAAKGDAGFWKAHDLLYESQSTLGDATFERIAGQLGLSWTAAKAAIRSAKYGAILREDTALSDRIDVQATPTAFVNGRKFTGARAYDTLKALVEEQLVKARGIQQSGTARRDVYARVMADAKELTPATDSPAP